MNSGVNVFCRLWFVALHLVIENDNHEWIVVGFFMVALMRLLNFYFCFYYLSSVFKISNNNNNNGKVAEILNGNIDVKFQLDGEHDHQFIPDGDKITFRYRHTIHPEKLYNQWYKERPIRKYEDTNF